jgi:hypothetical protein
VLLLEQKVKVVARAELQDRAERGRVNLKDIYKWREDSTQCHCDGSNIRKYGHALGESSDGRPSGAERTEKLDDALVFEVLVDLVFAGCVFDVVVPLCR